MDKQATDAPSTRPTGAGDHTNADRPTPTLASPAPRQENASRVREFCVSEDGQIVEDGYGHGV